MSEVYGLHPDFEQIVLWYAASDRKFWSRVGHAMESAGFEHQLAEPIWTAIRAIDRDAGSGPGNTLLVLQRMRQRVNDGKLTLETLQAAVDMFEDVEDHGVPDMEAVITELLPVVRGRMQKHAIEAAHTDYAKQGDFTATMGLLDRAHRLGEFEQVDSTKLDLAGFDEIEREQSAARLATGILELDMGLSGGMRRAELGVWLADTGVGKSMGLIHGAGECVRQQLFCGFATLELGKALQLARLYANITAVPINDIIEISKWRDEARRRFAMVQDQLGHCEIAAFTPTVTTVRDLAEWIDQAEQTRGQKMDALFVDYADKMHHPGVPGDNQYHVMRFVYEGLRCDVAVARDMWVWTASAAKGTREKLDVGDAADSKNKGRVSDLVIAITRDEETEMLNYFVAKNRTGPGRFSVGPLVSDYARGRAVPVVRELGDWR